MQHIETAAIISPIVLPLVMGGTLVLRKGRRGDVRQIVTQGIKVAATVFFAGCVFNLGLKVLLGTFVPGWKMIWRPSLCPQAQKRGDHSCEQCGMWPRYGGALGGRASLGMPSGHAQLCGLVLGLALTMGYDIRASVILLLLSVLILMQRVDSGCHTNAQVWTGWLVGLCLTPLVARFIIKWCL